MPIDIRSGSLNYTQNSSSVAPNFIDYNASTVIAKPTFDHRLHNRFAGTPRRLLNFSGSTTTITNTITETLTIKYYQRVYDTGTEGWCYYTKTSIDATPDSSDTSPNYTGDISNHSIVKILEIY
jgi:hypothetical protein